MIYYYHWSYTADKDAFFAFVDDGTRKGEIIFQIDTTHEICTFIKQGQMNHIDDTEGLESYLKRSGIMQIEDSLLFREENVWV